METGTAVAREVPKAVARQLRDLVDPIKEDLQRGGEAGMPYYRAAGEKMLDAKEIILEAGEKQAAFARWIKSNFDGLSVREAYRYMALTDDMTRVSRNQKTDKK